MVTVTPDKKMLRKRDTDNHQKSYDTALEGYTVLPYEKNKVDWNMIAKGTKVLYHFDQGFSVGTVIGTVPTTTSAGKTLVPY